MSIRRRKCDARVALAAVLAKRQKADLSAVFVLPPPDVAASASSPTLKALELALVDLEASASAAGAEFQAVLRKNGLRGRWLLERGSAPACVIRRARAADLVVLGQRNPNQPQGPGDARRRDTGLRPPGVDGALHRIVPAARRAGAARLERQPRGAPRRAGRAAAADRHEAG